MVISTTWLHNSIVRNFLFMEFLSLGLLVSFLFSGCVPYYFTVRQEVFGRIVDDDTGMPICSARIFVNIEKLTHDKENYDSMTYSDLNGCFKVPEAGYLSILYPLGPYNASLHEIRIEAIGYHEFSKNESISISRNVPINMGDVRLILVKDRLQNANHQ